MSEVDEPKAVIGQNCDARFTIPDGYETRTASECSVPILSFNSVSLYQEQHHVISRINNCWLLISSADTGTQKGSNTKVAPDAPQRKHKLRSESKKLASIAQVTKSKYYLPPPVVGEVRPIKGWEEWEDQLIIALRAEGKTDKQISQHLPGRSKISCQVRRTMKLEARTPHPGTQEKDALAFHFRKKQYWSKRWEEWEDQIVVTQRTAGESWERISEMLPPRTPGSVKGRGELLMKQQPQEAVTPQKQPFKKRSVPTEVKPRHYWKLEEEQLLVRLRESGKIWPEIATHLPLRTPNSCRNHWHGPLRKDQGPRKKNGPQWEEWEERLLVSGFYACLGWKAIAESIPGRTKFGAKSHWYEHFRAPDRDKAWTPEDLTLLTRLRDEGTGWDEISEAIPGHTVNACRAQWYKVAEDIQGTEDMQGPSQPRPDAWSAEEADTLIALYNTIGPRFQEICKHIPGRTENACHRWLHKCTAEDGVGEPPSEYWKEYFMSMLRVGSLYSGTG